MVRPIMLSSIYPRRHPSDFEDIEKLIEDCVLPGFVPEAPIIDATSQIRTQGSCFAENIHNAINISGFTSSHFAFAEAVNSPMANHVFFDKVFGDNRIPSHPFHADLFPDELISSARRLIPKEDVFIFTVGVAGCWFDKANNTPCIDIDPKNVDAFTFRWLSAEENAAHLTAIIECLQKLNPNFQIILTLSPVPLNRAFGMASAVVADCLSKSTLRVAIDKVMSSSLSNVHYWPSFEIVRWLGGHLPPVYGTEDGNSRHVSKDMVDTIVRLFLKYYAGYTAP